MSETNGGLQADAGGVSDGLEMCPFCHSTNHTQLGLCPNIDPEQLAVEIGRIFVRMLADELTPDEFAEMQRRNATPEYAGCCASHDFRDTNLTMARAFESVGLDPSPMDDDTDIPELWNLAWESAKPALTAKGTD